MHRFFIDKEQINEEEIIILGGDVKHIRDVLRMQENENLEVCCSGTTYTCEILKLEKHKILTNILSSKEGINESKIHIALFQGLAKGSKLDFILQKGTEIGIKEFYPVATHRSVVKIKDNHKEDNKLERWESIVLEAAKQSKRDIVPIVNKVLTFDDMINLLKNEENIIIPYEDEVVYTIKEGLQNLPAGKINIVIGPEGGFESSEIDKLKSIGGKVVTLGNRILRTETAGIVTATIILYELGNIGVI